MQKHLKKGRLTAWLLASALFVGSMPMSVMAEEPGGAAAGKTAVYFVADSEVEGVPFEELVSGMESFMESSAGIRHGKLYGELCGRYRGGAGVPPGRALCPAV